MMLLVEHSTPNKGGTSQRESEKITSSKDRRRTMGKSQWSNMAAADGTA
jgi:hypothetical protein